MVKTKIQLLEEIYELKKQDVERKDFYEDLYYKVRDNKISISDAEAQLIVSETFYRKIQGKPLAENMLKFSKGLLKDKNKILKMTSSMITQLLIMQEQDPNFNMHSNHFKDILDILFEYADSEEIDYINLAQIITHLGCFVDKNIIMRTFNITNTHYVKQEPVVQNKITTSKALQKSKTTTLNRSRLKEILSAQPQYDSTNNIIDGLTVEKINNDADSLLQSNAEKIQAALANVDVSKIIN